MCDLVLVYVCYRYERKQTLMKEELAKVVQRESETMREELAKARTWERVQTCHDAQKAKRLV